VFLTFHGERAVVGHEAHGHDAHAHGGHGHDDHGHGGGHLHDAPPAMAAALLILAVGSVVAGVVGIPHVLGGSNRIESFLESSFHPAAAGAELGNAAHALPAADAPAHGEAGAAEHAGAGDESTEKTLMGVSVLVALLGIGIAAYFFLINRALADSVARNFSAVYRTLLNKYWVDEFYDAAVVQPLKWASDHVLWKVIDVWIIDGIVNGVGVFTRGAAAVIRMTQTGSIRTYAASLVLGVVLVLGYYLMQ